MATAQEVYDFLLEYVNNIGGRYNEWYAGITDDIDERFAAHNVTHTEEGTWAHQEADSEAEARSAEKALLDDGFDGGQGGGKNPTHVYVFLKTVRTNPSGPRGL